MTCTDVILHARSSSSKAAGVQDLAQVSLGHSESGVQKVLAKHGCKMDVPISYVDLPTGKKVPYIKMKDWIHYLASTNRLECLVGTNDSAERRSICLEFWRRLEWLRPHHPAFKMARQNLLRLEDTLPLLHHGDEGRSYKKAPIMILSSHGLLGRGCHQASDKNKRRYPIHEDPLKLNFIGSTLKTHFLFAALPQKLYKNCPEALDTMLEIYAQDMTQIMTEGVRVTIAGKPQHLFFVCLAVKGDLPYLAKSGHMSRTFGMVPRQPTSKKPGAGICWMCKAGIEGREETWPWEDFGPKAKWLMTRGCEPGFADDSPLMSIPHDFRIDFYRPDLWHCYHLGCAKSFTASAMVILVEYRRETGESSIESCLQEMSADFRAFCKRTKRYNYVASITRDLLGWEKTTDCPTGHWYKGHLTTRFLEWMEDYLERLHKDDTRPFIALIVPPGF